MATKKFSVAEGYLAWIVSMSLSFLPISGLHRFYLGRANILYHIPGIGHVLSFFDVFSIPRLVKEANLRLEYKAAFEAGRLNYSNTPDRNSVQKAAQSKKKKSIEHVILSIAKKNKGIATPSEVALEADISMEEAKKKLETLVSKGFAELKVRSSGAIAYTFPDFFDNAHSHDDFEDI